MLNHIQILEKTHSYELRGPIYKCFASYFENWTQFTYLGLKNHHWKKFFLWSAAGLNFRPISFLYLHKWFILKKTKTHTFAHADDTAFLSSASNDSKAQKHQTALNKIKIWPKNLFLSLDTIPIKHKPWISKSQNRKLLLKRKGKVIVKIGNHLGIFKNRQ